MCTNKLIESLKKYPEVNIQLIYIVQVYIFIKLFFRTKNQFGIV